MSNAYIRRKQSESMRQAIKGRPEYAALKRITERTRVGQGALIRMAVRLLVREIDRCGWDAILDITGTDAPRIAPTRPKDEPRRCESGRCRKDAKTHIGGRDYCVGCAAPLLAILAADRERAAQEAA